MKINMPEKVSFIIDVLETAGFEGYAVGGCVRDSILGRVPKDWDITTNASPEEVKKLFRRTVDTGIEHGTVTVLIDKEGFEVTTYRVDGKYEDHRHPSEVTFTRNLGDDLLRRDFTINAMAYNDRAGLVDLFGGTDDLSNGIIRAVGNPMERFKEDALRIMRAVRFAAELGFDVEEETFAAMRVFTKNLADISAERIRVELQKMIMGPYPEKIQLAVEAGITDVVFPEWNVMTKTGQENDHHIYNVADHTIVSIKAIQRLAGMHCDEKDYGKDDGKSNGKIGGKIDRKVTLPLTESSSEILKKIYPGEYVLEEFSQKEKQILCLTMLLHDVGKPSTKSFKDGKAHFYGHQKLSSEMAAGILHRLKYDNETIAMVKVLILHHDDRFRHKWEPGSPDARRLAGKIGVDALRLLIPVQYADAFAQAPYCLDRSLEQIERMKKLCSEIHEKQQCVSLKSLAVNGRDLSGLGIAPGPEMGRVLNLLLDRVIDNPELNTKDRLTELAKKYK
ncbi:MAG: CCA tRNA nucleotidyltransferase [Lachnospiraceae bacterium]